MFFSNLCVYSFKEIPSYNQDDFEAALTQDVFRKCGDQDFSTFGWSNALGRHGSRLSHFSGDVILICAKREEKVLPAAAINEMVDAKASLIERDGNRPIRRRERQELKEDIVYSLLPKALTKSKLIHAFIDLKSGLIVINSGNFNIAEDLLALLRKSLGTLPVVPVFKQLDIGLHLKNWLTSGELIAGLALGVDVDLYDPDSASSKVKLKQHDLSDVVSSLNVGFEVSSMDLDWQERIKFVLTDSGMIKRVRYTEIVREQNACVSKDDIVALLDADLLVASSEIVGLINALSNGFLTE